MASNTAEELARELERHASHGVDADKVRERQLIINLRRVRTEISLVLLDDVYRIAQPAIDRVMHCDAVPTAIELTDIVTEARERLMIGFTELVEKGPLFRP